MATSIAQQLARRIAFKKAMKQAVQRTMKAGAKGVRIQVSGRLGGSEMARREWDKEGRIPLNGPTQVSKTPAAPVAGQRSLASVPQALPAAQSAALTVDTLVNAAARSTSKRSVHDRHAG